MKKVFNLSVILAVLMAAFSFTSCSDEDDDANISIKVSSTAAGDAAYVTVTADDIESIMVGQNGSLKEISSDDLKLAKNGKEFKISNLTKGQKYTIQVRTKDAQKSVDFVAGQDLDDNNNEEGDIVCDKDEVAVEAGDAIAYTHGSQMGQYTIKSASATEIVLVNVVGTEITLSDAGSSYILTTGLAGKKADADAAGEILLAKVSGKAMIAGGASSQLKTQYAKNATKLAVIE